MIDAWGRVVSLRAAMCRFENSIESKYRAGGKMGLKPAGEGKGEKPKGSAVMAGRSRKNLWIIRATTTVLLWTCVMQLTALGDMWGPRVLKGWPSCFTSPGSPPMEVSSSLPPAVEAEKLVLPPKSEFVLLFHLVHGF